MTMLTKIRKIFFEKNAFKTYLYWILTLLAIVSLFLILRGCNGNFAGRTGYYIIGRQIDLEIELLGRERSLVAFTNDLISEIGSDNNFHFQWNETNPGYLFTGLDNGRYNFILTTLRPNIVNEEKYDFSEPIFNLGPVLIVRQDSQFTSLKDMKSRPIGIPYGMATNFNAVRTPGINVYDLTLIYYNNMNKALEDLQNDQIDGVIMKAIHAYAITEGLYEGKLKVVTPPLNDEGLRLISLKSSSLDNIIDAINESVDLMRQDGTYKKLIHKWDLVDPETEYSSYTP